MRRDDPLDELYEAPPRDFVARRNAIAARLRKAGRAEDAREVAGVARPKATIWAINRVARATPKAVKRVVTAFDALKHAQLRTPAKIAETSAELREAMEAVVHEAIAAMKEAGLTTTLDTHRRISNTLRGAAASARSALLDGRLEDEVAPGGFDLFGGATPSARPRHLHVVPKKAAPEHARTDARVARENVRMAREEDARRRAAQMEEEARERERAARSASAAVLEARQRLRELEAQARVATRTAAKSRSAAGRAQRGRRPAKS